MIKSKKPILGFAAWSGTGKTTLLRKLIPVLRQSGIRIAMIKHAHHKFDVDKPGKDSFELRKAGASQMLICSSKRTALMTDFEEEREPLLQDQINCIDHTACDLILVEGFKHESFPKIELHRPALEKPLMYQDDRDIIALATDEMMTKDTLLQLLDLNDPDAIAGFILKWLAEQGEHNS
jgi:molybdopterin-guanine dinucleotide biosynthesis protein MobB